MFKNTILALSLILAGCSASKPEPVAPPPITAAPKEEVKAPPVVVATTLSTTTKVYSGPTWSVAFPDNMAVSSQDDDSVIVEAEDHSEMRFVRKAGDKSTLDDFTSSVVAMFMMKGHEPSFMGASTLDKRPANVLLYQGGRGVAALVLTATGSNTYGLIYMGVDGAPRVEAFKAAMNSVKLTDKVMPTAKPVKK